MLPDVMLHIINAFNGISKHNNSFVCSYLGNAFMSLVVVSTKPVTPSIAAHCYPLSPTFTATMMAFIAARSIFMMRQWQ
jgi:hypothetical protein